MTGSVVPDPESPAWVEPSSPPQPAAISPMTARPAAMRTPGRPSLVRRVMAAACLFGADRHLTAWDFGPWSRTSGVLTVVGVNHSTLAEIVTENPAAARILEGFGLDYCCQGDRTLAVACAESGIAPDVVTTKLAGLEQEVDIGWTTLAPPALADHIVDTHHRYLHEELPLLDALAAKVLAAHGERHPELREVRRLVAALRADLEPHLMKEERVVFPAIHAVAAGRTHFPFGPVANPIRRSEEHTSELQSLRHL